MTSAVDQVETNLFAALSAGDAARAQVHFDELAGMLPEPRHRVLQARIDLAAGRPERVIAKLGAEPEASPPEVNARFLLARAHLEVGDPGQALRVLNAGERNEDDVPAPMEWILRLDALAASDDRAGTVAVAAAAVAAHSDILGVASAVVRALATVGELDVVAGLIADLPNIPSAALAEFVAACLAAEEAVLLYRLMPRIVEITGWRRQAILRQGLSRVTDPAARHTALKAVTALVRETRSAGLAFGMASQLFASGDDQTAEELMAQIGPIAKENVPLHEYPRPQQTARLELLIRWLGIAPDDRTRWLDEIARVGREVEERRVRLFRDPGYLEELHSSLKPADLSPLAEAVNSGKGAIMATSHGGLMNVTLFHLDAAKLPVTIVGGNPLLKRVLPGGDLLNPVRDQDTPVQLARRVIRLIRAGRVVGLAADGLRGAERAVFRHRGVEFDLSDSIPKMAFRYGVPVIWVLTHWRDHAIHCDCTKAPMPRPGEDFEDYRSRWFGYFLDQLFVACHADPANANFNLGILNTRVSPS